MKLRIALAAVALLVLGMSGVASAQAPTPGTGELIIENAIPGGVSIKVTARPQSGADIDLGTVLGDDSVSTELSAGTYTVMAEAPTLNASAEQEVTIVAGSSITLRVTRLGSGATPTVTDSQPLADDDSETSTARPRPQTVTVPSRVDTGAGGATTDGARELVLGGLAAAAAVGALTLGLRRRTTA